MERPARALDVLAVADWRRHITDLYCQVRTIALDDPAAAHAVWVARRDDLFAHHPASPLLPAARASFTGLRVAPYDPAFRLSARVRTTAHQRLEVTSVTGAPLLVDRIGRISLGELGDVALWGVRGWGGGVFLPLRDGTTGAVGGSFAGGRYVLDTAQGADLGRDADGLLVIDLNFAHNPPAAYDPSWVGPAPTRGNAVSQPVPVGELAPEAPGR